MLERHEDSRLTLEQTAVDQRFAMPYRKTWDFTGDHIDERHRLLGEAALVDGMIDVGVPGWLLPADALKLYEMVFFCGGDVLELGTYHGLSAMVSLEASLSAGLRNTILSVDTNPNSRDAGMASLAGRLGHERVLFFLTTADEALDTFGAVGRRFRFCFVDHSHRYEHVRSACERLAGVIEPGGFCLFHDYNDPRNALEADEDYGVYQGAADGLDPELFEFWGIYGCSGLFRRTLR
jgi:hypothetical protein